MSACKPYFIGLMSGTSLDGVDGVLVEFPAHADQLLHMAAAAYIPFPPALRESLMALQLPGADEIHREAQAANALAACYADCVCRLLQDAGTSVDQVRAIGAHGQTIRHRPELGYTRQAGNPALLAELTAIDVVADFRSRDIAAGGQGAPLVPAFHAALFGTPAETRVVANIGGIGNISILAGDGRVSGFDTGPGNVLLDAWCNRHRGRPYDEGGAWAATGRVNPQLLEAMLAEPYFGLQPPKSTGRDLFHADWLDARLGRFAELEPADVQATLAALTSESLAAAIAEHAADAAAVYVCGGGAYNIHLLAELQASLAGRSCSGRVFSTEALGVSPSHVEALAFAWLAMRHCTGQAGNVPEVTGARGARILGALYPA